MSVTEKTEEMEQTAGGGERGRETGRKGTESKGWIRRGACNLVEVAEAGGGGGLLPGIEEAGYRARISLSHTIGSYLPRADS